MMVVRSLRQAQPERAWVSERFPLSLSLSKAMRGSSRSA